APTLPKLKYFEGMKMMNDMMKLNGDMKDMGMDMSLQKMDMNAVMYPEITGGSSNDNNQIDHSKHMDMNEPKQDTMQSMKMDNMSDMPGMDMNSSSDIVTLNYD